MTREEFIKQRCEIDKITEDEFEETYRVVECNCGKPYCKGYRCLDLDDLLKENQELKEKLDKYENPDDMTLYVMWCTEKVKDENEKLKKQLEEINNFIKKSGFVNIEQVMLNYCGLLTQQKEFIKYLEDYQDGSSKILDSYDCGINDCLGDVLSKYKEIIGGKNEK